MDVYIFCRYINNWEIWIIALNSVLQSLILWVNIYLSVCVRALRDSRMSDDSCCQTFWSTTWPNLVISREGEVHSLYWLDWLCFRQRWEQLLCEPVILVSVVVATVNDGCNVVTCFITVIMSFKKWVISSFRACTSVCVCETAMWVGILLWKYVQSNWNNTCWHLNPNPNPNIINWIIGCIYKYQVHCLLSKSVHVWPIMRPEFPNILILVLHYSLLVDSTKKETFIFELISSRIESRVSSYAAKTVLWCINKISTIIISYYHSTTEAQINTSSLVMQMLIFAIIQNTPKVVAFGAFAQR